jgi:inositol phosphorylceramide synthase regulatory subunit
MISLSMLFNRVTGFYGLLAILTGFRLDATQFSMYLYSVAALILLALLMPHIRKQSPLECLALAWFYAFDTVINCVYTVAFAVTWFLTVRTSDSGTQTNATGSGTMNGTAGFISTVYNVSKVDVVASPSTELVGGQDAAAIGKAATATAVTTSSSFQHVPSLVIIVLLTLIRFYFALIVMAYARQILRKYLQTSSARSHIINDGSSDLEAENPFAPNMPLGQRWRGKLGRTLLFIGRGYFLDGPVDDDWARGVNSRFKPSVVPVPGDRRGTFERERRARSGTGPPLPPPNLTKLEA